MSTEREFVEYIVELLLPLEGIRAKRMFGGYGLFRDGLMFGLIAGSTLYFKTDSQNLAHFTARELEPFTYPKAGKVVQMSYYRAPEEAFDNSETMCEWAEIAYQAARRAQQPKRTHPTRKPL